MGRTKKQAKPKIETVREQSEELRLLAEDIIPDLCPNLKDAAIVYVMETRANEAGEPVEPRTEEKMGRAKAASRWDRLLYHWDFRIQISGNWWAKLDAQQKHALLYHELCHCFIRSGKPVMQKHEFEGFFSELQHFGAWLGDLQRVKDELAPQLSLEYLGEEEPAAAVAAVPIAEAPAAEERADPFGDDEETGGQAGSGLMAEVEHAAQ